MNEIRIKKVETRGDLRAFIRFPWRVYKNDPNWVPPLILDMKERLDKNRHPFFEHAEAEYFLALRGEEVTGRIAAVHDRYNNSVRNEKAAFFGFYESLNDRETAQALLDTAAEWGRSRGLSVLRGPMNLSMNDECAFLLDGFDSPPAVMMTYNPPYYIDLMGKCGMVKAKDLYAFRMSRDHRVSDKIHAIMDKVQKEMSFKVRTVNMKRVEEEAKAIAQIYNSGWQRNWGFVPWTQGEMDHMVKNLRKFADPELVIFAEHEGRTVGFAFGLPNFNEVLIKMDGRLFPLGFLIFLLNRKKIKSMRALVFGLLPQYFHTGLSYLLYGELEQRARAKGYEWGELSWQLEDNEPINRFAASVGAEIYKTYRIFEKPIAS